jgi:RNA polymerase sigma-70 factor (ECF subfamily)
MSPTFATLRESKRPGPSMTNSLHVSKSSTEIAYADASDEQLLLNYRDRRDVESFEALVHRYEKPIYNYLLRYLRSGPLADEVFQATFLRLYEKCGLYDEDQLVRPWLYSIATHQAIDALRKEGKHQAARLDDEHAVDDADVVTLLNLLGSETPSPLDQAEEHERAEWTRKAVDELPDHQRVAVLLIFFQGLKYREVAEILQVPEGTIKSRIHKSLLALNKAWRRTHDGAG